MFKIKEYTCYRKEEILALYKSVGWTNYTKKPEMLKNAYENSLKVLAAYNKDKLIGIIRVVGDGFSLIYIQDIIVLPNFQGKGIGTQLLQEILKLYSNVYQKILLTDNKPQTIAFYKKLGFQPANEINCLAFAKFNV